MMSWHSQWKVFDNGMLLIMVFAYLLGVDFTLSSQRILFFSLFSDQVNAPVPLPLITANGEVQVEVALTGSWVIDI